MLLSVTTVAEDLPAQKRQIKVSTGEYAPYTSESSAHGGFVNRVIKASFALQNVEVLFSYFPWKRALDEAASGAFEASSFWFIDKERAQGFYYSDGITHHRELLFHLKSTILPDWESVEDLRDFTFGATLGYTYTRSFWEAARAGRIAVHETRADELNFKKLLEKRIDIFPMEEITGWQLVNKRLPSGASDLLTTHPRPLSSSTGHLIFSKQLAGNEELVRLFNQGLRQLRESGVYKQYLEEFQEGVY
jgi:polar amino acid transport system substrate-binding protein